MPKVERLKRKVALRYQHSAPKEEDRIQKSGDRMEIHKTGTQKKKTEGEKVSSRNNSFLY
jgi:hypothetical protein